MPKFKINLTISLFVVVVLLIGCSEKTDKQEEKSNALIKENEKVNEAIMDKDWNTLYDIKDQYRREVKHLNLDSRGDFLRDH